MIRIAAQTFLEVEGGARWPAQRQHTYPWRGERRRKRSPLMISITRTTMILPTDYRQYESISNLCVKQSDEILKMQLFEKGLKPQWLLWCNPGQKFHFGAEVLKHLGFSPAKLQSFTDCSWRMTSPICCCLWTKRGAEYKGTEEEDVSSTRSPKGQSRACVHLYLYFRENWFLSVTCKEFDLLAPDLGVEVCCRAGGSLCNVQSGKKQLSLSACQV